jgi:hypothetical protein
VETDLDALLARLSRMHRRRLMRLPRWESPGSRPLGNEHGEDGHSSNHISPQPDPLVGAGYSDSRDDRFNEAQSTVCLFPALF